MAMGCRAQGKRLFFVTNNSTKSRAGYLKKFTSLGLNVKAVRRRPAQQMPSRNDQQRVRRTGAWLRLGAMGCLLRPQEEIYSSSYAAAAYLESIQFGKKVYVIGEEGIQQVRAFITSVPPRCTGPRASRGWAC